MIISRTPVRISFFGGGTDYKEYYKRHKGAVLGTTINKYMYVSLNRLSDFFNYKIRVSYSKSELTNSVSDIIHPSVRECLKFKDINGNLDIHIFSDLPAKTGLGSSSSFTVGFLNAIYAQNGQRASKKRLSDEAIYIEQEMIKENVGSQDQVHAAYGGLNIIEFSEGDINIRPVVISSEKRAYLEECMMVFYTGIDRFASDIVKEQIRKTSCGEKDDYLNRMYHMVFEAEKIISDEDKVDMLRKLGALIDEGWSLKKKLSSEVSNDWIDELYMKAKESGALGGKISGAGGGGFLTFFAEPDKQDSVRNALKDLLEVDFKFENEGSSIIYYRN